MILSKFSDWWNKNINIIFIVMIVAIIVIFVLITLFNLVLKKHRLAKATREIEKKYDRFIPIQSNSVEGHFSNFMDFFEYLNPGLSCCCQKSRHGRVEKD